jgi:hypothetical protein
MLFAAAEVADLGATAVIVAAGQITGLSTSAAERQRRKTNQWEYVKSQHGENPSE